MKTISVAVSESDYAAFQRAAKTRDCSTAQLIRNAMAQYRETELEQRGRLEDLPLLPGHRPLGRLPARAEVYDEIFRRREAATDDEGTRAGADG